MMETKGNKSTLGNIEESTESPVVMVIPREGQHIRPNQSKK